MSAAVPAPAASRTARPPSTLAVGIVAFAVLELALAVVMAAAPHSFYEAIGPFGAFNGHYVRDVASFEGAIGIALALSLRRPSWQAPVLAVTTIQFALHSVNHLIDIDKAHPAWTGYFDFFSLAAATVALAWLWRQASREAAARAVARQPSDAGPLNISERSLS